MPRSWWQLRRFCPLSFAAVKPWREQSPFKDADCAKRAHRGAPRHVAYKMVARHHALGSRGNREKHKEPVSTRIEPGQADRKADGGCHMGRGKSLQSTAATDQRQPLLKCVGDRTVKRETMRTSAPRRACKSLPADPPRSMRSITAESRLVARGREMPPRQGSRQRPVRAPSPR